MGALASVLFACARAQAADPVPFTLDDLFAERDVRDAAISPSGRYVAVVVRQEPNDVIVVQDPRLRSVSPIHLVDAIKADVLLIHGDDDGVVPFSQSQAMKRALDNSHRKITLLKLEDEGHSYWSDENQKLVLETIDAFLLKNLGPGYRKTHAQ